MNSPRSRPWHHSTQQYTLLEYASLKETCPEGIYLSLKPGSPAQWSGVLFVRKGPYAPAILRFHISFPTDYPTLPPSITFISDIFHPLVAPLTTYTYTTGSSNSDTVSATDEERLPPGGFSLRHGFPHWFGRAHKSATSSTESSRNVSITHDETRKFGEDAYMVPPPEDLSSRGSSQGLRSPLIRPSRSLPQTLGSQLQPISIVGVLQYLKRSFDDEGALDTLPLEAAGNSGAWKAWRAYRRSNNPDASTLNLEAGMKQQDEWSWDGVWEMRVRKGIDASIAESTLYGGVTGGDHLIRFVDMDDDLLGEVKKGIADSIGTM
ncbi:hypothetical protein JMJ35_003292 [Cladonia borealis]|uniref:UBC core domain-containing protein n=1 Tax=Cladonia borealis TaxID=184061 RepID=A0AA39R4J3_9LECA|nr:hypothetical protein JMJ35_003292 [Cladonia borealis]